MDLNAATAFVLPDDNDTLIFTFFACFPFHIFIDCPLDIRVFKSFVLEYKGQMDGWSAKKDTSPDVR